MSMRLCVVAGCPTLFKGSDTRCPEHRQQRERARGTRQERGYDAGHDRLRAEWEPRVATGTVVCWRCGRLIKPGTPWDLGHDDVDRTRYRGPEHAHECNRAAAGRAAHHQSPGG